MKRTEEPGNETPEFARSVWLLVRKVRSVAPTEGISLTEAAIMTRLDKEGPETIADLARAEGVKPQSMGASVASLEKAGLVKRTPHATDGRQMLIRLTAKGVAKRAASKDAKLAWLAQAMDRLDGKEQQTLLEAGRIMRRLTEL